MTTRCQSQAVGPPSADEYLEGLRDGRTVWLHGERVDDVTRHPAFAATARSLSRLYTSLHEDPVVSVPTDTGSGTSTHAFFRVARSADDLRGGADAIAAWARLCYGFVGRTPDYMAALSAGLGADPEFFGPHAGNARHWYGYIQERVPFLSHAIVNPPVDRGRGFEAARDVLLRVEEETGAGLVVSGAKVVATGALFSDYLFIGNAARFDAPDKALSATFLVPINSPGLSLICRPSYELAAARTGSPFDYPLSSRLDENDAAVVFDRVLVPWENVLCYDVDRASRFFHETGFIVRGMLHGCTRMAVKLDFLAGLLVTGLEMTGSSEFRGVQTRIGEVLAYRTLLWSCVEAMVSAPTVREDGSVLPNVDTAMTYRVLIGQVCSVVREIIMQDLGSSLIYFPSHAADWKAPQLRPLLDRYLRGSGDRTAVQRAKLMKLLWDAIGSEFGGRQELYERNFLGNHEVVRLDLLRHQTASGQLQKYRDFVQQCLDDYDLDGWVHA